uniref:Kunitz-type trypsin protease inhibitor 2 n=1 Tax=Isatis tinctoria TaxID=161756 RepID=C9EIV4_ISATI|nr:Kunitz-type trypsin protease inhibitor 2 [Isatis tinctoria]
MMPSFPSVSFLMTLMLAAAVCAQEKQVVREVVKDTAGNAVQTYEQYFIQPVKSNGGGLIPLPVKVPLCPLGINQVLRRDVPGLPVSFVNPYRPSVVHNVYTTEFVNIELKPSSDNDWPVCKGFSNLWTVAGSSSASDEPPILVGDKQGHSYFKIERDEHFVGGNVYKLSTIFDGIIGTVQGPLLGLPQLVLTTDTAKTLLVKFIKVENATTTSRAGKLGLRMFPLY